jgi:hypothetical protein
MIQPRPERESLTVLGQLLTPKNVLLQRFRSATDVADLKPLLELEDNYVAVYTSEQHVWIVNSLYSLNAYFYAVAGGAFLQGDTIAAVAGQDL